MGPSPLGDAHTRQLFHLKPLVGFVFVVEVNWREGQTSHWNLYDVNYRSVGVELPVHPLLDAVITRKAQPAAATCGSRSELSVR